MPIRTLTSKSNPAIRLIRLVAAQARRAPPDLVLAEGIRALEEALASGLFMESVLITERFGASARESAILEVLRKQSANLRHVPESVFRQLSCVQANQGILALVKVPLRQLSNVTLPETPLVLCACGIQDPGNLGTLVRTAAAAGVSLMCTLTGTVSARNPKAVRASAGTVFRLPLVERAVVEEFMEFCRRKSMTVLCAAARGGLPCYQTDFTQPSAILLGNEGSGIEEKVGSGLRRVQIPMSPGIESLNVAAAGAVLLFEARRQRAHSK